MHCFALGFFSQGKCLNFFGGDFFKKQQKTSKAKFLVWSLRVNAQDNHLVDISSFVKLGFAILMVQVCIHCVIIPKNETTFIFLLILVRAACAYEGV